MKRRMVIPMCWLLVILLLSSSVQSAFSAQAEELPSPGPTSGAPMKAPQAFSLEVPPTPEAQRSHHDSPLQPTDPSNGWVSVGPGIEFREFALPDPNAVHVARLARANPQAIIESSIAQGKLSGAFERMSDQASRYDQALNYWGQGGDGAWGGRNRVVVAINGSYFDGYTGIAQQGVFHSSWYAKRFDFCQSGSVSGSGFAWRLDRTPFIGGPVSHPADKQVVTYITDQALLDPAVDLYPLDQTQEFQGINVLIEEDQLILYTPQWDSQTPQTDSTVTEVVVEMAQPDQLRLIGEKVQGVIKDVRTGHGKTWIPFDHVVLMAEGSARTKVENYADIGEPIYISHRIKDCSGNQLDTLWNRAYASVGGAFYYLENGTIHTFPDDLGAIFRHPRTSIAYNEQYIFFIVVDGRAPGFSVGMTINELALFARDTLGATYGIAQDGGGSSTMVVNGVVVNNTFCNNNVCRGAVLLPVVLGGGVSAGPGWVKLTLNDVYAFEQRSVANGMLMVVVEPLLQTTTFTDGQGIITTTSANLRLGPGTNYAVLSTINANTHGVVLPHSNGLNGVLAKGYHWWKVRINGLEGWIAEELIAPDG
jgi:hypothetical protein